MKKTEKYIIQRYSTKAGYESNISSYYVYIPYYENGKLKHYPKNFKVEDYQGKPSKALKAAIQERDRMMPILTEISKSGVNTELTVKELYEKYKRNHPAKIRTIRNYDQLFRKYIGEENSNKLIKDITEDILVDSLKECAKNCCSRNVSKLKTLWKRIYTQARKEGIHIENLAVDLDLPESAKDFNNKRKRRKNISEEEFQIILKCARTYGVIPDSNTKRLYNRAIIADMLVVMRDTGIRPAEAKAIHKSLIRFEMIDGEEIAIIPIVSSIGSTEFEELVERETKTASSVRDVYMHGENVKVLKKVMEYSKHELMFSDYDGNPFPIDQLSDYISRISKKCGIKFNLYLLRHSYSSDLYASGATPIEVKELMGHADEKMSMNTYASSEDIERIKASKKRKYLR